MTAPVKFKREKLPVKFGGVSFDDRTASIGLTIQLESLDNDPEQAVVKAYRWLCTRHIKAQLVLGRRPDGETQGTLLPDGDITITAEFDTNTNGTSTKKISNRLSVDMTAINCEEFRHFAKREGWLVLLSVMDAIDLEDDRHLLVFDDAHVAVAHDDGPEEAVVALLGGCVLGAMRDTGDVFDALEHPNTCRFVLEVKDHETGVNYLHWALS